MGIMKTLIDKIYMVLLAALLLSAAGCSDDDDTSLALNGDTWITSFHIEGYDNFIVEQDNQARSIKVHVEDDTDVTNLIPVFTLSEGATANLESGKPVKFSYISKFHIIISCKSIVYIVMCFYQETN